MRRCAAVVSHSRAFPLMFEFDVAFKSRWNRCTAMRTRHSEIWPQPTPVVQSLSSTTIGTPTYHEIAQHPPMLTTRTGRQLPGRVDSRTVRPDSFRVKDRAATAAKRIASTRRCAAGPRRVRGSHSREVGLEMPGLPYIRGRRRVRCGNPLDESLCVGSTSRPT